jgi:hypothetical protein
VERGHFVRFRKHYTGLRLVNARSAGFTISTIADPRSRGIPAPRFEFGGYHDYAKLVPHLTNSLADPAHAIFTTKTDMDILRDPHFADGYDAVSIEFRANSRQHLG